jgi:hypothetical protein
MEVVFISVKDHRLAQLHELYTARQTLTTLQNFTVMCVFASGGSVVASKAAVAKGISPILATANMEESILFYQSVLGFRSILKSADYSIAERDGQPFIFRRMY